MSAEARYQAMSVRELKACIKRGGMSHSDCFEIPDLRKRAMEADARAATAGGANGVDAEDDATSQGLRARRTGTGGGNRGTAVTQVSSEAQEEEATLKEKATALVAESGKMNGRSASEILADATEFRKRAEESSITVDGRKEILEKLDEVQSALSFEANLEKRCGRIMQLGLLGMTLLPMLVTFLENSFGYATRPVLEVSPSDLTDTRAVVTGGCGAVGLELAVMLADAGAGVVIACHGNEESEFRAAKSQLRKQGLLRGASASKMGWVDVWPLRLESFESVREFAGRVTAEMGNLDILAHNAATKEGCSRTEDGMERIMQVNYLSPFLLTQLLLPTMQKGHARVVHVTCDAALQMPDWLPWPLRRIEVDALPHIDLQAVEKMQEDDDVDAKDAHCSPLLQYANSKLALLAHSHELNRRFSGFENRFVSHTVNPGAMDTAFAHSVSVPAATGRPSARASMMSKLPPVWIANQIYAHTAGPALSSLSNAVFRHTLRTPRTGASAVLHVATSLDLADEEHGGLFSDAAGAFINCGKSPEECGRVKMHKMPLAALDEELAADLWDATETAIGPEDLRPVSGKHA